MGMRERFLCMFELEVARLGTWTSRCCCLGLGGVDVNKETA